MDVPGWSDVYAQERHSVASLEAPGCFPDAPGVYARFRGGEVVYLGVATRGLRRRLGTHLRPTRGSVRRTTLKRTIA